MHKSKVEYLDYLEGYLPRFKHIYIFGAGMYAQTYALEIMKRNLRIDAFVVTEKKENRLSLNGLPVISLAEISTDSEESAFIIGTSEDYHREITESLHVYGYRNIAEYGRNEWFIREIEQKRRTLTAIEITTKIGCSVNCRYCPQERLVKRYFENDKKRKSMLSLEDYKTCLEHLPEDTVITFSGFCEPFLNPACANMIVATAEHGNRISLHTTFVGATMRDFDLIKDVPFEYVGIHLPDQDNYAQIPITAEYKEVLDHVLDAKKKDGTPWELNSNCQSSPAEEIIELINHRMHYTKIHLLDRAGNLEDNDIREDISVKGALYCPKSPDYRRNILLPDGSLVLCCMDFGLEHRIGNLIEQSYEEIRNSAVLADIQNKARTEDGDIICRRCSLARRVEE